jgi:prevent-host-death family protein
MSESRSSPAASSVWYCGNGNGEAWERARLTLSGTEGLAKGSSGVYILYVMGKSAKVAKISTTAAREEFSEIVNRAAFGKERVVLTRHGKGLVAVVPVEDLEVLEALEDRLDIEAAEKALASAAAKDEAPIPWETAKRILRAKSQRRR